MQGYQRRFSTNQILKIIIVLLMPLYFTACSYDDLAQDNLYPYDQVNKTAVPDTPPSGYKEFVLPVTAKADDGKALENPVNVHGWSYKASDPKAAVLIYFHGNGMNLGTMLKGQLLKKMETLGVSMVIFDYPSYGKSTGLPNEYSLSASAEKVFQWTTQNMPGRRIFIWGRSMGTAVASKVIAKHQDRLAGWILTSPWSTLSDLMTFHFGDKAKEVSESWKKANVYNVISDARTFELSGVIHHGSKDDIIPFSMGKLVLGALEPGQAQFVELTDREHNDVFTDQRLWDTVLNYIK